MGQAARAVEDLRKQPRDPVEYRTRAMRSDGLTIPLLIVNTSVEGLMARYDYRVEMRNDERLRLTLPVVGEVCAVVRWVLGGRIGCELEQPIAAKPYRQMLATVGPPSA